MERVIRSVGVRYYTVHFCTRYKGNRCFSTVASLRELARETGKPIGPLEDVKSDDELFRVITLGLVALDIASFVARDRDIVAVAGIVVGPFVRRYGVACIVRHVDCADVLCRLDFVGPGNGEDASEDLVTGVGAVYRGQIGSGCLVDNSVPCDADDGQLGFYGDARQGYLLVLLRHNGGGLRGDLCGVAVLTHYTIVVV